MKRALGKFLIGALFISVIGMLALYGLEVSMAKIDAPLSVYALFPFFLLVMTGIHYALLKASQKRPQLFVTYFMGIMAAKMFLALIIILVYSFFDRSHLYVFAITFFVLYMAYTAYELNAVLRFQNTLEQEDGREDRTGK